MEALNHEESSDRSEEHHCISVCFRDVDSEVCDDPIDVFLRGWVPGESDGGGAEG